MQAYNYIVVGAGTAGCVLAARLTEEPGARVLLLEAGSAERTRAMAVPSAWPENLGSAADWGYVTTSQAGAGPLPYPRGRALGGSGAINAMAHVRGHPASYDRWAAGGAPGWGFADLLPYFRRTERAEGRDPARLDRSLRGTDGPIRVAPAGADRHPVARAFAEALTQNGCPVTDDLSGRVGEGVAWADLAIADGERVSPADGYLRPVLSRPNLDVATSCVVTRLNIRHGRCTGVSYVRDGVAADAVVDPGFLTDEGERDLDRLAAGLRMIRQAVADASFAEAAGGAAELYPGPEVRTDAALRDYIRHTVDSYYHPVGSCRMGSDEGAVVDPELRVRGVAELRVRGVAGLRVADASIMPLIPNAHPHATVLAIAERAAP